MQRRSPYIGQMDEPTDDSQPPKDWSATGTATGTGYMAVPQSPALDYGNVGRRRSSAFKVDLSDNSRRGSVMQSARRKSVAVPKQGNGPRWLLGALGLLGISYLLLKIFLPTSLSLTLGTASSCPNPLLPRPAFSASSLSSTPITLPSISPLFSLALHPSPKHCNHFRLSLTRREPGICRRAAQDLRVVRRRPSGTNEEWDQDDEDDEKVKARLGPDGFLVQLEGAERRAEEVPSGFDPTICQWTFDFALSNAGPIWMNVTHMYEDYQAIADIPAPPQTRPKPKMLMRPLVSSPFQLSLCPANCAPFVVPAIDNAKGGAKVYGLPSPSSLSSLKCPNSTSNELEGAYLPTNHFNLLFPPQPLPLSETYSRATAGMHSFIRPTCLAPSHDGLRFRDHASCLREEKGAVRHRSLIIGDSHGRAVFDVAAWRVLKGEKGVVLSSPKALSKKEEKGGWGLEFAWDPYLNSGFSCEYLRQFDSITVSAGTHSAAWDCPSTATHLGHLSSVLSTWPSQLRQCLLTSPHSPSRPFPILLLLTMPSFHPQLHNRDCRTGARIALWNEGTKEIARREGWGVIDYELYTRAMAGDSARVGDGVHYLKTDALDPLVDDWIGRLNVCGDEDHSAKGETGKR